MKKETKALVNWDEEMAKQAVVAAGMEQTTATGQFFSLKAGQLSWAGAPVAGNQMAVVVLDSVMENIYYASKYDAEVIVPPTCFAFGRDEKVMEPHESVVAAGQAQNQTCAGCKWNAWGSSDLGKGKACRNTRRLGLIPAGTFGQDGSFQLVEAQAHYETATVGYLKLPVTSVAGYSAYVKQVAGALKRPPHGLVTRVRVVPDPKTQMRVLFDALVPLPAGLLGPVMQRHAEVQKAIEFPYSLERVETKTAQPKKNRKY